MSRWIALVLLTLALISCAAEPTVTAVPATAFPTPVSEPTPTVTVIPPTETPELDPATLWIEPHLDSALRTTIETTARHQNLPQSPDPESADLEITLIESPDPLLLTEEVYVVADRFATVRNGIKFGDIQQVWKGKPTSSIKRVIG